MRKTEDPEFRISRMHLKCLDCTGHPGQHSDSLKCSPFVCLFGFFVVVVVACLFFVFSKQGFSVKSWLS